MKAPWLLELHQVRSILVDLFVLANDLNLNHKSLPLSPCVAAAFVVRHYLVVTSCIYICVCDPLCVARYMIHKIDGPNLGRNFFITT